jgi:hypothetical protein
MEEDCTSDCLLFSLPAECMSCLGASSCDQILDGDCSDVCNP